MSERAVDLGIEITVEPNVVPKGTVDLRSFDAAPGTTPPPVKVEANGRVVRLTQPATTQDWPAPSGSSLETGAIPKTPAPIPTTPAAQTSSVAAHQEAIVVNASEPAMPVTAIAEPKAPIPDTVITMPETVAAQPLGAKLRKRGASGVLPAHADTAMPPRPASADELAGARKGGLPETLAEDYETAQISGGFASALGALVKVTLVLVGLTLLLALPLVYYWDQIWSAQQVASNGNPGDTQPQKKPDPVKTESKPDVAPVPTASASEPPLVVGLKPDVPAVVATPEAAKPASSSAPTVGVGDQASKPEGKVETAPVAQAVDPAPPKASGGLGSENDLDLSKVEELRADAVNLYRKGNYAEAIAKLKELLAASPKDADALFRLGLALNLSGDLKAAEEAYLIAAKHAGPKDARAWNNLGIIYERLGRLDDAKAAFQSGLAANPRDPNVLTNLGRLERDAHPDAALERYDAALKEDPRNPYARYERGSLLALGLKRAAEGQKVLETLAAEDSPVRAKALDALGQIADQQKKYADSEKFYRRALADAGAFDEVHLHLGVTLFNGGKCDKAEPELRAYLEKNPKSADAWKTLGAVLAQTDRLAEAKVAYESALRENDKDVTTLYNYALCAERFGNFRFAIEEYDRVIKIDPTCWKALQNLGRLYKRAGRDQQALEYFDRALRIQPNDADLHLHKANALHALNRLEEMRGELEAFVKLAPAGDKRVQDAQRTIAATTGESKGL